jgi:hypothetical protein
MSFRKDFRIIFLGENIGFKKNYVKRLGQSCGVTELTHWKKWVATLVRCGNERQDK